MHPPRSQRLGFKPLKNLLVNILTPEGAAEILREERKEWQKALNGAVKVARAGTEASSFLATWLKKGGATSHSPAEP